MHDLLNGVLRVADVPDDSLAELLERYGLEFRTLPGGTAIPGSHWGDDEAGLIGGQLYARTDTPVHSVLHEACHYVCMDTPRRVHLHTDAGGDYNEENAVCYLQTLLADHVSGFGRTRSFEDMDRWGYSFRLGSARAWFERDAGDSAYWLLASGLIDPRFRPTWRLRL